MSKEVSGASAAPTVALVSDQAASRLAPDGLQSTGEITCNWAEMIPLFQELFEPDQARMMALMGRMKNLQKLGGAGGYLRCGRGRTANYPGPAVWELVVLMELTQMGFPPAFAVKFWKERGALKFPFRADLGNGSHIQLNLGFLRETMKRHLPRFFYETGSRRASTAKATGAA